jgi:hypothetical protein
MRACDQHPISQIQKDTVRDDAGLRRDPRCQILRVFDWAEPAVEQVVALVGDRRRAVAQTELWLRP